MNLPFDVEEIPVEYRQLIKDGLASRASEGRFDVVLPLLESLINEGTKNGHIYTAQAYCSVEDIRNTGLIDDTFHAMEQAVESMKKARILGVSTNQIKPYRESLNRILRKEKKRKAELMGWLNRDPAEVPYKKARNLASELYEQGQFELCAKFWKIAEEQQGPDWGWCRGMRGVALWRNGQRKEAEPLLGDAINGKLHFETHYGMTDMRTICDRACNLYMAAAIDRADPEEIYTVFEDLRCRSGDVLATLRERMGDRFPDFWERWPLRPMRNRMQLVIQQHKGKLLELQPFLSDN